MLTAASKDLTRDVRDALSRPIRTALSNIRVFNPIYDGRTRSGSRWSVVAAAHDLPTSVLSAPDLLYSWLDLVRRWVDDPSLDLGMPTEGELEDVPARVLFETLGVVDADVVAAYWRGQPGMSQDFPVDATIEVADEEYAVVVGDPADIASLALGAEDGFALFPEWAWSSTGRWSLSMNKDSPFCDLDVDTALSRAVRAAPMLETVHRRVGSEIAVPALVRTAGSGA